jgi:hypothetical protein
MGRVKDETIKAEVLAEIERAKEQQQERPYGDYQSRMARARSISSELPSSPGQEEEEDFDARYDLK